MAGINWILYTEKVVGRSHPTLVDVDNRPLRDVLTLSGWDPDTGTFDLYTVPAGKEFTGRSSTWTGNVALTQFDNGTSGTAITINWNNGNNQRLTLNNNCTVTLSNARAGGVYSLELVQDASGSRTVTWAASPGAVIWPNSITPTLTPTVNKADVFTFFYDGAPGTPKYMGQTFGLNYAV